MANSKTDKTTKVMDVSAPGRTAPPASAKPIIVSNRPILRRDPMMATPEPDGLEKENPEITPVSRVAKTIKVASVEPLTASADKPAVEDKVAVAVNKSAGEPAADERPAAAEATPPMPTVEPTPAPGQAPTVPDVETKAADAPVPAQADQDKVTPPESTEPKPEAAPAVAPTQDSVPDDPSSSGSDAQLAPNQAIDEAKRQQDEAATSRHLEEEKIIASKQYYLPIASHDKRRGVQRAALMLVAVVVLGVIWLDIVLDAGIVHITGVYALTHFFG